MAEWSQNDVLTYIYGLINSLFSGGSPTATVYTSLKQRMDVDYTSIHGAFVLNNLFETPIVGAICGNSVWADDTSLIVEFIILAQDRSTAHAIYERFRDFLKIGKFQDTTITPPAGPSVWMYVTPIAGVRQYPVESELYGLRGEFVVEFFRY